MSKKSQIESRKKDHVELVIKKGKGAQYSKTSGFEKFDFIHNALPEICFDDIDLSTEFLGKRIKWSLLITGMTGGYPDAERINKKLAEAAQKYGLAFGVGSQRAMIEQPQLAKTYRVRQVAPNIPLLANIGAVQLKKYSFQQIESLVSSIKADGLAVHLNALQEIIQPEGDRDFSGILEKIEQTCNKIGVPVVVKETGAGISQDVAIKLKQIGVRWIDVSGAGGTSWSRVEYLRGGRMPGFEDWGIPTAECIMQSRGVLPIIASGGIRNGIDCAKAIALGADICGAAYPFIRALESGGSGKLHNLIEKFTTQMRICAFLTGSRTINELKKAKMLNI